LIQGISVVPSQDGEIFAQFDGVIAALVSNCAWSVNNGGGGASFWVRRDFDKIANGDNVSNIVWVELFQHGHADTESGGNGGERVTLLGTVCAARFNIIVGVNAFSVDPTWETEKGTWLNWAGSVNDVIVEAEEVVDNDAEITTDALEGVADLELVELARWLVFWAEDDVST